MTFPLDILTEVRVGDQWVPMRTYNRDTVVIERGRGAGATETDPGRLSITVDNRGGQWSPRNPAGPYYGRIGRNTPVRVSVPGTESYLTLDGAGYASTPDHPSLNLTTSLDLRWEGEADWYRTEPQILIGKWGEAGNRSYHMRLEAGRVYWHTTQDGTVGQALWRGLPALPRRAALRAMLDIPNARTGFYWAESLDGPWHTIDEWTTETMLPIYVSTAPLAIAPSQADHLATRPAVEGRVYRAQVRSGPSGPLVADIDFRTLPAGTTAFTDGVGLPWTVTAPATVRDRQDLFVGEVSEWPQHWTPDESDAWVPLEASGILRRMGQGRKALQSTLRRSIPTYTSLAYWPLEDGRSATQAASPVPGVPPLTLTRVDWASDDTLPSSEPLPVLRSRPGALPMLLGRVPAPTGTISSWAVNFLYHLDQGPTTMRTFMRILTTGTVAEWLLQMGATGSRVRGLDSDGATVVDHLIATDSTIFGDWKRLQFYTTQSGTTVTWTINWVDLSGEFIYITSSYTGRVGHPTAVAGPADGYSTDLDGLALGHISVWPTTTTYGYLGAVNAWTGERAWDRMRRLCQEERVPLACAPGPELTQQVGYQRPETLLTLLQQAADADGGLLLEDPSRPGLLYRERSSMYSQAPRATLSYDRAPGLAAPLTPTDDDTAVRNDRTVQRDGGSSGRAVLEEGPLSVQPPPAGVGLYDDAVTLSLGSDDQTEPIAYWRLHLGTVDEPRYPQIEILLHKAPHLIPAVTALVEGDLVRITDLPLYVGAGHADLLVTGVRHELTLTQWTVTLTTEPATPWRVGATAIYEDFSDAAFAVTITSGGAAPWTRSQAHYNSGTWALRSGVISNNQTSDAIVAVPSGASELSFWYWTSTEGPGPGFEGDRLLVLVDGVQVLRAQGTTPWTQATIDVTGASQVIFRYAKDNSSLAGEDAVYIDDLLFTMPAPTRVDANPGGSALALPSTATDPQLLVHTPARGPGEPAPWITSAGPQPTYEGEFPFDIQFGGETARVTACTPAAYDSFGRAVTGAWGTADCGFTWALAGGTAAERSVSSGSGAVTLTATPTTVRHQRIVSQMSDCDVLVRMSVDQVATGAALVPAVLLRYTTVNDFYQARVHFAPGGVLQASIARGTTTVGTVATVPYTYTAGQWVRVRARITGQQVQLRVWPDGQQEPALWHADQTITTSPIASGQVGVAAAALTGNSNTSPQLRFDDYQMPTPQLLTIQRSTNGVVKPHAVGTEVRLAQAAVTAL